MTVVDVRALCAGHGTPLDPPDPADKLGLARVARAGRPVHGMRVPRENDACGWFIWAGDLSEADDFFEPVHLVHIREVCPLAEPFLSLPAGWRFLTDGVYVDVWFDPSLLGRAFALAEE